MDHAFSRDLSQKPANTLKSLHIDEPDHPSFVESTISGQIMSSLDFLLCHFLVND